MQGRVSILTSSFAGKSDIDSGIGVLADITKNERFQPNSIEMDKTAYKNARKYFDALNELMQKVSHPPVRQSNQKAIHLSLMKSGNSLTSINKG